MYTAISIEKDGEELEDGFALFVVRGVHDCDADTLGLSVAETEEEGVF